jgi:putative ABC transport system permease protein
MSMSATKRTARPLRASVGPGKLFVSRHSIGQMYFGTNNGTGLLTEIVGVVSDVRFRQLDKTDEVEFYRPLAQRIFPFVNLCIRTSIRPDAVAGTARAALDKIDRELPIIQPTTMTEVMNASLGPQHDYAAQRFRRHAPACHHWVTAPSLYGCAATGEIGVRMASVHKTRHLRLVLSQGMKPASHLGPGMIAALALGWLLTSQLYQVSAYNPALLGATTVVLATVALVACLIPARRATQVNPIIALRYE